MSPVESSEFRSALGQFATGVTVVTTLDERGQPIGMTANSFNSVSLDPPMVLWSIARQSGRRSFFERSESFVVNVLAEDQVELSRQFASSNNEPFQRIRWQPGLAGMPLLPDCASRFQCRKVYQYDGGDHIIMVGEVQKFDQTGREALVFHRGKYAVVDEHPAADRTAPGGYQDDFLMALLMRATYEFVEPFKRQLQDLELTEGEVRVLTFLNEHDGRDAARMSYGTMLEPRQVVDAVDSLLERGLARRDSEAGERIVITEKGRQQVVPVLAMAKAHEDRVLAGFTAEQVFRLKRALRRLADQSRR